MSGSGTPPGTPKEELKRGYWVPDPSHPRGRRIVFPPETQKVVNQMKKEYKEKFPNLPFLIPIPFMPEEKFIPPPNSPRRNRQYRPNYMKPRPLLRLTENQRPPPLSFNENEISVPAIKRARNTRRRKNRKNKTRKSRN